MPGPGPHQARVAYDEPLSESIHCLVNVPVVVPEGGYYEREKPWALTLGGRAIVPFNTTDGKRFGMSIAQNYVFSFDADARHDERWRVSVVAYQYALFDEDLQREILAYHKHAPDSLSVKFCHLHILQGARVGRKEVADSHLPTKRISVEEFIRFLIMDFKGQPRRSDWAQVLDVNQDRFEKYRTWVN